jgi:DNA-binding NtrC family response regulator
MLFDRLSHVRIILLSEAFFGSYRAERETREEQLELELDKVDWNHRSIFHGMVGSSRVMQQLYGRLQAAAAADSPVLVSGESGTGKELVARAIHECSPRRRSPFVAVNCAALPTDLIESELFGHRRGAFSGATSDAVGLIRAAHGGTLLLDEITEMPSTTQAKLLRVLQDSRVRPVGGTNEIPVNVRYIASTNRDLNTAIESGVLREDLYYRLNVHHLKLPPLRERQEDIELLVRYFLEMLQKQYGRKVTGVTAGAMRRLRQAPWQGNVRELRNVLEVAYAYGSSPQIGEDDLPRELANPSDAPSSYAAGRQITIPIPTFEESERILLQRALQSTEGNKQKAARILGISRKQLYAKLKKYDIDTSPS